MHQRRTDAALAESFLKGEFQRQFNVLCDGLLVPWPDFLPFSPTGRHFVTKDIYCLIVGQVEPVSYTHLTLPTSDLV